MKKTSGNKIKLGIFISAGIILLIAGIYLVGNRSQLFSSTFHISGIFKDINGLQVGNNVRFSGINVGIVEDIQQITDSTVRVDMQINEHSRKFIKKNAKDMVSSEGLMGNKNIVIVRGIDNSKELSDNDVLQTSQPINIDDILEKVKETGDNAANITNDLAVIINNIRTGKGTIGKLFMDSSFAHNIDKTIINIKQGAGGFKENMDAASHNFLLNGFFSDKKDLEAEKAEKIKKAKEDKKEKIEKAKKDKQEKIDKMKKK